MATPTRLFSILFCIAMLATACEKEEVDNSDKNYPIQLTVSKPERNIELAWTKTNISSFESYIVVRSTDPIPDSQTPPSGTIATITDQGENTFSDVGFPFVEKLYYKVFVKVGDRFLFSPTVEMTTDVKLLDLVPTFTLADPANDVVYLMDVNQGQLHRYNYALEEITHTLSLSNVFNMRMAVGDNGEGNELYLNRNNDTKVEVYDAATLSLKTSFNVNGSVFSIASGNNGYIYVATDNWNKNFAVYKRSTKQLVSGASFISATSDRLLMPLPGTETVIDVNSFELHSYQVNSIGNIGEHKASSVINNFFGTNGAIAVSPDGNFFAPLPDGVTYNRDLEVVGSIINNNFNFFNRYVFMPSGDRFLAFPSSPFELWEFEFPTFSRTNTIPLNYSVNNAFEDDGKLVLVGIVFLGFQNKTVVDVLDI